MTLRQAVTRRLLNIVDEKKISGAELAKRTGLSKSTVYGLLDERREVVSINTVKLLCDALEVSMTDFFDDELFENTDEEKQAE